ncbi:sulfotransferase [Chitinophaga filiformis]|uniref:sulfotransferase n=1 Tax=Chitinophaga filiformis TaxID=104663 RepID=UPI001F1A12F5|nr:sulfotransferase [Chitinophaga filiformis]MCF6405273.1 sulfotransferase [Chitinophaga filiformis]
MSTNVLIITGMHRSGTSLLTQWLYRCGLHVGDRFLGAGIGNTQGHFEDIDFYNYHQRVLSEHDLHKDGLVTTLPQSLSDAQRQSLRVLIQEKAASQVQWGWKDPRTCLFLPFYREVLPNAHYLVILRDYKSVVSSLIQRLYAASIAKYERKGWLARMIWKYFKQPYRQETLLKKYSEHHLKVWITYNEAILRHLQQLPSSAYLVVDHSFLANCNRKVFDHLSDEWKFWLEYYDFNALYKESLISQRLDITSYIKEPSLLQRAADVQCRLQALAV